MKYRYHWSFKLLALVLAVVSGAVLVVGAAGMAVRELELYEWTKDSRYYSEAEGYCWTASEAVFDRFAWKDTGIEPKLFERFFRWGADVDAVDSLEHEFYYSIRSYRSHQIEDSNYNGNREFAWSVGRDYDVRRGYVTVMPTADYYPSYTEYIESKGSNLSWHAQDGSVLPEPGEGVTDFEYYVVSFDANVNPANISMPSYSHADAQGADYTIYRLEYMGYESYHVEVGLTDEQLAAVMGEESSEEDFLPRVLKQYAAYYQPMIVWGALVLAMSCFWLALVAGKDKWDLMIRPAGLNRVPLDLYLVAAVVGGIALTALAVGLVEETMWRSAYGGFEGGDEKGFYLYTAAVALCGGGAGLLIAMFTMALAAQLKVGNGYWLKHTTLGMGWKWIVRAVKWCWRTVKMLCVGAVRVCRRLVAWLPLTWQWVLISGGLWMLMAFSVVFGLFGHFYLLLLFGIAVTVLAVLYGAYGFGALRDGARKMSEGNLEEKIESKHLYGCFGEFAGHLNALGDACTKAAREQLKSERMKTELITNVSHDIKTPLTSIINYVDLLRRTGDEQQRREYLEFLDRQSQQLKKLIEDLMEMSRASSGNVAVEITPTDVCEAVNQALGEFSDHLDRCGLTVMAKLSQEGCMASCDGRHLWRVLSNCLSNVVKYALPGTRVYVDVAKVGQRVEISIKNISAQMLNITAGELMERFVRGDASRNTEGNGLGLNIAKSLMELQGGRLELSVDGDLFKVVLTLNAA